MSAISTSKQKYLPRNWRIQQHIPCLSCDSLLFHFQTCSHLQFWCLLANPHYHSLVLLIIRYACSPNLVEPNHLAEHFAHPLNSIPFTLKFPLLLYIHVGNSSTSQGWENSLQFPTFQFFLALRSWCLPAREKAADLSEACALRGRKVSTKNKV